MRHSALLTALLLLLSPLGHGHGVERGFVEDALSRMRMAEETKGKISNALAERCDLSQATAAWGEARIVSEEVDQGAKDYYYDVRLEMTLANDANPTTVWVKAAEYAISNPTVENVEILSIESSLCR